MSTKVISKILVPVELVDETPPNVDYAIEFAAQLGAHLILITARKFITHAVGNLQRTTGNLLL